MTDPVGPGRWCVGGPRSIAKCGRARVSPRVTRPCQGLHRAVFDRGRAILMFEAGGIGMKQGSWGKGTGRMFAFYSSLDAISMASNKVDFPGEMPFLGSRPSGLRCFAWILGDC